MGAINVRRLDSSDISSDYTVAGVEGTTEQALYKVDTQGYNSVWSNDISEIRAGSIAENPLTGESSVGENTDNSGYDETSEDFEDKFAGLTDLHDRWVFYKTNKFDESGENWMTEYYMEQYNEQVAQSGLAGLHAGLYKTGEGVLALTGENTYKGASIAAGGIFLRLFDYGMQLYALLAFFNDHFHVRKPGIGCGLVATGINIQNPVIIVHRGILDSLHAFHVGLLGVEIDVVSCSDVMVAAGCPRVFLCGTLSERAYKGDGRERVFYFSCHSFL